MADAVSHAAGRKLLDSWYAAHPYSLTQHHLESFDHFLGVKLRAAVASMNEGFSVVQRAEVNQDLEVRVRVGGPGGQALFIDRPLLPDGRLMYPNDARLVNATYAAQLYADVAVDFLRDGSLVSSKSFPRVRIGTIPIMLHSSACLLRGQAPAVLREMGECPFDQGGYFVIDGKEKVLIAQERIAYNRLFITRASETTKAAFSHDAFIRCLPPDDLYPKLLRIKVRARSAMTAKRAIVLAMPHVAGDIPLFVMFRALGLESDAEIFQAIAGSSTAPDEAGGDSRPEDAQIMDFLRASAVEAAREGLWTQEKAMLRLSALAGRSGKDRDAALKGAKALLVHNVLPNVGHAFAAKAVYLAYLVRRVVRVCIGVAEPTERDSWVHKRMDLSGYLIADLFRDVYRRFRQDTLYRLRREFASGPWRHGGAFEDLVSKANLSRIFDASIVQQGMLRSFKGAWNVDDRVQRRMQGSSIQRKDQAGDAYKREGVVQDLNRQSYQTYMAHVRRVSAVLSAETKLTAPHLIYAAQWGAVCPVDSPDGANVGILKHFTVLCHFTEDRDPKNLLDHLRAVGLLRRRLTGNRGTGNKTTLVFVNHGLEGSADRPELLAGYVRLMRRAGLASPDVSVSWDVFGWEVHLMTDGGRTCRPLVAASHGGPEKVLAAPAGVPWHALLSPRGPWQRREAALPHEEAVAQGGAASADDVPAAMARLAAAAAPVELIDTEELTRVLVSRRLRAPRDAQRGDLIERCTHHEIHPAATMLSPVTATLPMLDHNAGAYNVLGLAQTKQGLGMYASSFRSRMDVHGMVLHNSEVPLVTTYFADRMCGGALCHGTNVVVAIAAYGGYNQEDAVIVNATSAQRGLFRVTATTTMTFDEEAPWDSSTRVLFANPMQLEADGTQVRGVRADRTDYRALRADGTPEPGAWIEDGAAVLGMCRFERGAGTHAPGQEDAVEVTDATQAADKTLWGHVDRVFMTDGAPGTRTCKVRLREVRSPDLGDKLASRFGQKGVVGMLVAAEDMPFTAGGLVPDVVINPNGFPKRMTVAHVLEALLGRVACDSGQRVDATTFDSTDPVRTASKYFMSRPPREGWSTSGDSVLYNGRTGEQLQADVFVGVNYYNRLKHMAADKINFRATGPRSVMTHQATHGRSNQGGLKVGEMEQHCLLSHGAAHFLKESFFDRSDGFSVRIDERTGARAETGTQLPAAVSAAVRVPMPYSFKQFAQELEAMAIGMRAEL